MSNTLMPPSPQQQYLDQQKASVRDTLASIGGQANAAPQAELTPKLRKAIEDASINSGVPANVLLAIAERESGYNPMARSGSGGRGAFGLSDDDWRREQINPYIPAQAAGVAGRKLRGLLDQGLSVPDALKAYYGGADPEDVIMRAQRIGDALYPLSAEPVDEPASTVKSDPDEDGGVLTGLAARFLGSAYEGAGSAIRGVGEVGAVLGHHVTTPAINALFGTDYVSRNVLDSPAGAVSGHGKALKDRAGGIVNRAAKGAEIRGDMFRPSTWEFGDDPSVLGYMALGADVLGSMLPVVAASIAAGPVAAGVAGGAQSAGGGAEQAGEIIDRMDRNGTLEGESAYYRELRANGYSHGDARDRTKEAAKRVSAMYTAPWGGLGGFATSKIINPAEKIAAALPYAGRVGARAGLGAAEEGAQEVAEGVAARHGVNVGAGADVSLTEDSLANFVLGALGGGTVGAGAGILSRREGGETGAPPSSAGGDNGGEGGPGEADAPEQSPPDLLALPSPQVEVDGAGIATTTEQGEQERVRAAQEMVRAEQLGMTPDVVRAGQMHDASQPQQAVAVDETEPVAPVTEAPEQTAAAADAPRAPDAFHMTGNAEAGPERVAVEGDGDLPYGAFVLDEDDRGIWLLTDDGRQIVVDREDVAAGNVRLTPVRDASAAQTPEPVATDANNAQVAERSTPDQPQVAPVRPERTAAEVPEAAGIDPETGEVLNASATGPLAMRASAAVAQQGRPLRRSEMAGLEALPTDELRRQVKVLNGNAKGRGWTAPLLAQRKELLSILAARKAAEQTGEADGAAVAPDIRVRPDGEAGPVPAPEDGGGQRSGRAGDVAGAGAERAGAGAAALAGAANVSDAVVAGQPLDAVNVPGPARREVSGSDAAAKASALDWPVPGRKPAPLKRGDDIGTLMFNGGATLPNVKIKSISYKKKEATVSFTRDGKQETDTVPLGRLARAVDAAKRAGVRPDGWADMIGSRVAVADGAQGETKSDRLYSIAAPKEGPFGPIFDGHQHDATGAVARLMAEKSGEATAALYHPGIGDIDLVWGREGTAAKDYEDGYGLAKIAKKHPEIIGDLQGFVASLPIKSASRNRIVLAGDDGRAVVRLDWSGEQKRWLLTAYGNESVPVATEGRTGVSNRAEPAPPASQGTGQQIDSTSARQKKESQDRAGKFAEVGKTSNAPAISSQAPSKAGVVFSGRSDNGSSNTKLSGNEDQKAGKLVATPGALVGYPETNSGRVSKTSGTAEQNEPVQGRSLSARPTSRETIAPAPKKKESRSSPNGEPQTGETFSSRTDLHASLAAGRYGRIIHKLIGDGRIVLHKGESTLPRSGAQSGPAPRGVQGMYADRKVHLVASNQTPDTALPVLLHEMFHGAVALMDRSRYQNLMARVGRAMHAAEDRQRAGEKADGGHQAFWDAAMKRVDAADTPIEARAEELAAYAIEHREQAPDGLRDAVDGLVGVVKAWLVEHLGVQVGQVTPAQLRAMAVAALRSHGRGVPETPVSRRERYSSSDLDTFAAGIMTELAAVDDLFQNPRSRSATVRGAVHDIDPTVKFVGDVTAADERRESGADRKLRFETARGDRILVFERNDEVWIDVGDLGEGTAGSAIYSAVMDYAANTGKTFIGDPAGLSDIALRRRTEAMISSALKHGSTDHMQPHQRQVDGDKSLGIPPLSWRQGDTAGNLQRMIDVSLASLASQVPEFRRARYDFQTGTFRTGEGKPLTDGMLRTWRKHPRVRAAGAGSRTLKRGILLNTLARAASGERPGLLERSLRQPDQLVGSQARRIFYSVAAQSAQNTHGPSEGQMRNWLTRTASDTLTKSMPALLKAVPLDPLITEIAEYIQGAQDYLRHVNAMDAHRQKWAVQAHETVKPWLDFIGRNRKANARLMEFMHETTLAQVDPSVPFRPTLTKVDEKILKVGKPGTPAYDAALERQRADEQRRKDHARFREEWDGMDPEARRIYQDVRDQYKAMADERDAILIENARKSMEIALRRAEKEHRESLQRIDRDGLTGQKRNDAVAEADEALAKARRANARNKATRLTRLRIEFETNRLTGPYFRLARFGKYFVHAKNAAGETVSFSRHEKLKDQRAEIERLKNDGHAVYHGVMSDNDALKQQVNPQFVADIEQILQGAGVDRSVLDEIWQRYLETAPDMSIRTSQIHRKGTPGFAPDAVRAFTDTMAHGAYQNARLKYIVDMNEALKDAREQVKAQRDPVRAGMIVNEIEKRHQFVMNPLNAKWAQLVSTIAFFKYLALTPAHALLNLTQTPMLGLPVLAAYHGTWRGGFTQASSEVLRASRDFMSTVSFDRKKGQWSVSGSPRLLAHETAAMKAAEESGLIERTMTLDLFGLADQGIATADGARVAGFRVTPTPQEVDRVKKMASWGAHHTERFNREVTYLAAYRMARRKGETQEQAIDTAHRLTVQAHFNYSNAARPRIMQSDVGKATLVFRNYSVNMLARAAIDIHRSMNADTPQARKEAKIRFLGISAMMASMAGISATWFIGTAMWLAGMVFGGDDGDIEDDIKKALVKYMGETAASVLWRGLPSVVLGVDISSRIGMGDLWFRWPDRDLDGSDLAMHVVGQALGAGFAATFVDPMWALDLARRGHYWRAIEKVSPKQLGDAMKTLRFGDEGALTLKGEPIKESFTLWELSSQFAGFRPLDLATRQEQNTAMKSEEKRIMDQKKEALDRYFNARKNGKGVEAALRDIQEFNKSHPYFKITKDTIRQSHQARARTSARTEGGIVINPKLDRMIRSEAPPRI